MTLLYYDPFVQEHKTGNTHAERPERMMPIVRHLNFLALDAHCRRPSWKPVTLEQVARVHDPAYVDMVKRFAEKGGGWIEEDTFVSEKSYDVALLAAGAPCDAVARIIAGEDNQAFCLIRPPGHHALPSGAMGFCLLNNVAVAAQVAIREHGLERVMIVDWDVHHGNGTQDIFWQNGQVGFVSIHRSNFYPHTGNADELGTGDGLGTTLNVPVEFGTSRAEFLSRFNQAVESMADKLRPQLVILSAGFDAHRLDPIGSLGLETEDYEPLTLKMLEIAKTHADGRLISVLEGGYNPEALAECAELHLETLMHWQDEL